MRQSHTAVLARNEVWSGEVSTEPYEAGWASEAILFLRVLEDCNVSQQIEFNIQISPDGMHWCDEGTSVHLSGYSTVPSFARVSNFGNWIRLHGYVPDGVAPKVIVYAIFKS